MGRKNATTDDMKHTSISPNVRYPSLERYREEIGRCVRCGGCGAVCPSYLAEREESFSARGRMALIEAAMQGRLPVSRMLRQRLASCTGCLACEAACPGNVPVARVVQAAKEAMLREQGGELLGRIVAASLGREALMRSFSWLAPLVLHFAGSSVKGRGNEGSAKCGMRCAEWKWRGQGSGVRGPLGKVAFFPGCAVAHFQQDIERATVSVLNAVGYEVIVPKGLSCCGRPLLSLGDRDVARKLAERNTAVLSSLEVDAVVTACASCGLTFKKEYPTLLAPSGQKSVPVLDIHEFLAGKLGQSGLLSGKIKVTWHDPCHLGRGQGLSRTARSVLGEVPGIELVEMENPGQCCGLGGPMRLTESGHSDRIGALKAKEIAATGASLVVTGCPGCRMQITEALRRAGSDAEVVHTVQVLEAALPSAECGMRSAESK